MFSRASKEIASKPEAKFPNMSWTINKTKDENPATAFSRLPMMRQAAVSTCPD
jgi:hypothetical protein